VIVCVTEPLPLNELAIRHNAAILEYCRTSISALAGSTAGILGLTGLYGFAFYFLTAFMMSVCIMLCNVCSTVDLKEALAFFAYKCQQWRALCFHIVCPAVHLSVYACMSWFFHLTISGMHGHIKQNTLQLLTTRSS